MFKEQELLLAQQIARLATWEWRADTDEMRWLPGSASLLGRPLESIHTKQDILNCIVEDDRERVARMREEAVRNNGTLKTDYRVMCDGSLRWIRVIAKCLERPDVGKVLIGVLQDVTADKRREEKLRAQARLLDLAHEPILVRDAEGRISYWNSGAEHLYGYTRNEAVGRVSHELLRTKFPDPLDTIQRQLDAAGVWEGKLIHASKDGRLVRVESRWKAFTVDSARHTLETDFDVTQQQALEVLRVWEEKARLIGEMSHEINNPLSIAMSATHLLKTNYGGNPHQYIAMLEDAITRIADFIRKSGEIHRDVNKSLRRTLQ